MYVLLILVSITLILLIFATIIPLKIKLIVNSEELLDFRLKFSWLKPFFNLTVQNKNNSIVRTVHLFNKQVSEKGIVLGKNKEKNNKSLLNFIREIKPKYMDLQTSYGFNDPSITGIICGTINVLSQYANSNHFRNEPDFYTDNTYFNINAYMELNLLAFIINYFKYSSQSYSNEPIYQGK